MTQKTFFCKIGSYIGCLGFILYHDFIETGKLKGIQKIQQKMTQKSTFTLCKIGSYIGRLGQWCGARFLVQAEDCLVLARLLFQISSQTLFQAKAIHPFSERRQ